MKRNWALTTCDHSTLQFSIMRKLIKKRENHLQINAFNLNLPKRQQTFHCLSRDHFIKKSYWYHVIKLGRIRSVRESHMKLFPIFAIFSSYSVNFFSMDNFEFSCVSYHNQMHQNVFLSFLCFVCMTFCTWTVTFIFDR